MSIYAGLIILQPITNKQRYLETINEIRHCLHSHSDQVIIDDSSKTLLTLKSKYERAEASFSLSHSYLHTTYYRISGDLNPSEEAKTFANILWECLSIFKENFASRVEIFQENLDVCGSFMKNFSADEILRRQISSLISKKVSNEVLKKDEIDDILCILDLSVKKKNIKGIHASLELLHNKTICPAQLLASVSDKQYQIIEELANSKPIQASFKDDDFEAFTRQSDANKSLATSVLARLIKEKKENVLTKHLETRGDDSGILIRDEGEERNKNAPDYEKPASLKTCLFQILATNDISRVSFLLQTIIEDYIDQPELLSRLKLFKTIVALIDKYSGGDYGFDNIYDSKYCIFQNRLLKVLLALFKYDEQNLADFSIDTINKLSQVIEECCLYIVQNVSACDRSHEFEYKRFYELSLRLFEVLVGNHCKENLRELVVSLKSIEERIRLYFAQADDEIDGDEINSFSVELKRYYESIRKQISRSEALEEVVAYNNSVKYTNRNRSVMKASVNKENIKEKYLS